MSSHQADLLFAAQADPPALFDNLPGMGHAGKHIRRTFACMDLAEEEIAAARARHPGRSLAINSEGFGLLCPRAGLAAAEVAYRSHCAEILDAIGRGEEPPTVTWAEVCLAFAAAGLKAPLGTEASVAYGLAFRRAFPTSELVEPSTTDELYMLPEAEALIAGVRRRLEAAQ